MPIAKQKITPCRWFNTEAEDAAKFYCSVFKNAKLGKISRFPNARRTSTASQSLDKLAELFAP